MELSDFSGGEYKGIMDNARTCVDNMSGDMNHKILTLAKWNRELSQVVELLIRDRDVLRVNLGDVQGSLKTALGRI